MSVWLPKMGVDRVRRRDRRLGGPPEDRPLLLARDDRQRRVVAQCCDRASEAGVRPGVPIAEAKAILASAPRIEEEDTSRDLALLRSLGAWAHRFSPMVALDEPDGLLIDITGCDRALGGERSIADSVLAGLGALGFVARVGIGPTIGCAWGVTRHPLVYPPPAIVPERDLRRALGPLPVRALRIEDKDTEALGDVGIETVGQLMALPRAVLPARFGERVLMRLDQALGSAMEPLRTIRQQEAITASRAFDGPCTRPEGVAMAARDLIADVCAQMHGRGVGARRIELHLERADMDPVVLTVTMSRASRQVRHVWALLCVRLERADLGHGVDACEARALQCVRVEHDQREWDPRSRSAGSVKQEGRDVGELVDAVRTRFGRGRVVEAHAVESHRPERAYAWREAGMGGGRARAALGPADRPTILFEHPAPIEVSAMTPDGPLVQFTWRGHTLGVRTTIGPERIAGEWWRCAEATRDYFKVQDDGGRWLWVFHEVERGSWFVHGVWG